MTDRVAKVPGSKWRLAGEIVARLPRRRVYVEPFFGSGAILCAKRRWPSELINDLDGRVAALFRAIRDQPEELARAVAWTPFAREEWETIRAAARAGDDGEGLGDVEVARRFLALAHQSHGNRTATQAGWRHDGRLGGRLVGKEWARLPDKILRVASRFRGVLIENRPAVEVIERYQGEHVAIVADPPYPRASIHGNRSRCYRHEMLEPDEHGPLLDLLIAHRGPVIACSYPNDLYDAALLSEGWERHEFAAKAEHAIDRVEALYINPVALRESPRQVDIFRQEVA